MRLIDADMLDEEVMHLFIAITGTPKQSTVVNECKKSFRKMIDEQPTIDVPDTNVGKQTNADRIRSMTDDELLDIILCPYDTPISPANAMPCAKDGVQQLVTSDECHKCMMKWLQSEAEE